MDLVRYPDPGLRNISRPVAEISEEIRADAQEMLKIMYRCRGVGLAGPQAGLDLRLVVSNLDCDPAKHDLEHVYANLRILEMSGTQTGDEGCLSLPGMTTQLARARHVTVEYTGLDGQRVTEEASDFKARMFQHEADHLDGILIIDRMSRAERLKYAAELKELERTFKKGRKRARARHPASR